MMFKSIFTYLITLVCLVLLTSTSYETNNKHRDYYPVFMTRTDLEQSVYFNSEPRTLKNPGKIYIAPPYLYVNERYKGVHIIDNRNPSQPIFVGFISAPGCIDMAVKGSIMYLDNAVDLVAVDLISKKVTSRVKEVFPEVNSPDNIIWNDDLDRPSGYVLVEWRSNK